jgi:hypothetical protein
MKNKFIHHIILSICLIVFLGSCSSGKKGEIIGLNQNIHHDDFEYAVTDFTKTNLIVSGNDTLRSRGNFYLVNFRVINKALRVNHQWDNSIGYLVDENGNRYENIKDHQKSLDKSFPFGWKEMYNTPHGQTDTTILVFDLPVTITKPYLMVRGDILMGDAFDGGRFQRVKVRLF